VDAQSCAPQHDDERAKSRRMHAGAGVSDHRDDLGDARWIGGEPLPLVARRPAGMKAWQRGRRARATGGIEKDFGHDASLRFGGSRTPA
jgi:hypothetical protein